MKRLFFPCFFLSLLALSFSSCGEPHNYKIEEPEQDTLRVFEVEDIDSVFYFRDVKYLIDAPIEDDNILFRDSVYIPGFRKYLQRKDTIVVKKYRQGLTLKIISDSLRDTLTIEAGKAVFRSEAGTFEFSKDVHITSGKYAIFTENITFDRWQKKFKTESPVQIETLEEVLKGEGIEADISFSKFVIKHVSAVIHLPTK